MEYRENKDLLGNIQEMVDQRVKYLENCRKTFSTQQESQQKKIDSYIDSIIKELLKIKEEKKKVVVDTVKPLDDQLVKLLSALKDYK